MTFRCTQLGETPEVRAQGQGGDRGRPAGRGWAEGRHRPVPEQLHRFRRPAVHEAVVAVLGRSADRRCDQCAALVSDAFGGGLIPELERDGCPGGHFRVAVVGVVENRRMLWCESWTRPVLEVPREAGHRVDNARCDSGPGTGCKTQLRSRFDLERTRGLIFDA